MNLKIIINSLILIFIIHIILININYTKNIGNKVEKFNNGNQQIDDNIDDSLKFLTNTTNENDILKEKLMKYMQIDELNQTKKESEFEDKNLKTVKPSNSYLSNDNQPNFESNVADISKFYKVNYDNLDGNDLQKTSDDLMQTPIDKLISIDTNTGKECNTDQFVRKSTENPDVWSYKNELPMNGGLMNGISGFDSLESQFSSFNLDKMNLQLDSKDKFDNIPHDDLRKPIIYEN